MIRSGLKIIPDHLYVLILVALLLSGEMFGCIPIDFERVKIRNNIINFSAVLIVPIFMVLIIYLLFNCISKQYFENISLLMEKQVEQQVEHYKRSISWQTIWENFVTTIKITWYVCNRFWTTNNMMRHLVTLKV